jgi:hypothetical protein
MSTSCRRGDVRRITITALRDEVLKARSGRVELFDCSCEDERRAAGPFELS